MSFAKFQLLVGSQCVETWIEDQVAECLERIVEEAKKYPKQVEIIVFKDAA